MKNFDKDTSNDLEKDTSDFFHNFSIDKKVYSDGDFRDEPSMVDDVENIKLIEIAKHDEDKKDINKEDISYGKEPKKENKVTKPKNNNKNNNNAMKVPSDIFKVIGLIVSGLLLVISIWIMTKCFTPAQKVEKVKLSYNTTDQVDYRVFLVPNDFYETSTLGVGELVPVTFIDKIEIDFTSFLSANKQLDMNYSYRVNGVITTTADDGSSENSGGKIWTKNYELVAPQSLIESATTGYNVQEKVVIDYNKFNELVNQYKLRAAIPMKAVLAVTLTVDASSIVDGEPLNVTDAVTVNIPLSVSTLQITTSGDGTEAKTLVDTLDVNAKNNFTLLAISAIIFIASLITTISLLKSLRKMTVEHSLIIKFNKIMRDYSQVIIEIEELPDVINSSVIEVKNFRDMLDVQKELHLPIMCCKSKTGEISDNVFYIVNQNQIFKYMMNDEAEKI